MKKPRRRPASDTASKTTSLPLTKVTDYRQWLWWLGAAAIALIVASFMRLPQFGALPAGLNRDEAALGYNAFSLLKTGRDEWGREWPISITSFGDQKLPGYIYTLIPFIAAFGAHDAVVRLPSLLASLVIIIGMGLLAKKLAEDVRLPGPYPLWLSLLTMLFLAVSPWQMHAARTAYESHLALSLFISGLVAFEHGRTTPKTTWQRYLLILASALWSLTLLTYHSYHIFLPLFLVGVALIEWKRILGFDRWGLGIAVAIGLLSGVVLWTGGVIQANAVKNQGITPFSSSSLLIGATEFRSAVPLPGIVDRLLFNKLTEGLVVLSQNVTTAVSGEFLFVHGSGHGDHNPGQINNFSLFLGILLAVGILGLVRFRRYLIVQKLAVWLIAGILPASLTIQPRHEIRLLMTFPALELIGAIGAVLLLMRVRNQTYRKLALAALLIIVALSALRTFVVYTVINPARVISNERYTVLAKGLAKYQATGMPVITQSVTSSPYIWYLFENQVDPAWAQATTVHYPATDEGFLHVKQIGNISFETINWDTLYSAPKGQPKILVLKPSEISDTQRQDPRFTYLENLPLKSGATAYEVWSLKP